MASSVRNNEYIKGFAPKLSSRSDQAGGLGAWGQSSKISPRELPNEANMVTNSSKISSRELQNEANMGPTCLPKGALEASKRPLDAEIDLRLLVGVIFDLPKSSKLELKFDQTSSADLERSFWPFGGLWGSFGARFWAHFDFIFGLLRPEAGFLKIVLPPKAGAQFSRFRGIRKEPKRAPKTASSSNVAPRASWVPLEFDFRSF